MKSDSGSPYVRIFTSLGEVTSRIVDFTYKYSQKEDDICQLRVESNDPNMPDYPEFQEGAIYKVVWGYIGDSDKASREVVVRNVKATYSTTMVALDLLCTDRISRIKGTSSKKVHKGTIQDIANDICKKNGVRFQSIEKNEIDGQNVINASVTIGIAKPGYYDTDNNWKSQVDNTQAPKNINLRIFEILPQANKSDHAILKEAVSKDPNGPWEVVGRDNNLTIQRKPLNQKPLRSYTWSGGDGELLNFVPESKNFTRKHSASNINTTIFNPEKKQAYSIDTNEFTNGITKLADTVDAPPRALTQLNKGGVFKTIDTGPGSKSQVRDAPIGVVDITNNAADPTTKNSNDSPAVTGLLGKIKNAESKPNKDFSKNSADKFEGNMLMTTTWGISNFAVLDPTAPAYLNSLGNYTAAIGTTAVVHPARIDAIDYNKHLPSEEHSIEDAAGKAKNLQAIAALAKNPAESRVIGYALLESGKVLTILNASKKYSGNYYIEECTHRIVPNQDYHCDMKMARNGHNSTKGDNPTEIKVDRFDINLDTSTQVNKELGKDGPYTQTTLLDDMNANQPIAKEPGVSNGIF